jgi:hypothetical protein
MILEEPGPVRFCPSRPDEMYRIYLQNPEDEVGNFLPNVGKKYHKHMMQQPIRPGFSLRKYV